jgi:hypothetical protein
VSRAGPSGNSGSSVDFTQEAGQLTVKLGIRRSVLLMDFAADIDALYS